MKLKITGRHTGISAHLRTHVAEKVSKLDRFNDHIIEGEIVLSHDSIDHVAEGKVHLAHATLTAKGKGGDMYSAVNELVDKLLVQLKRHEGRLRTRKRTPPKAKPDK